MERLKLHEIVEIPKDNPIITFKKLEHNMLSPYQCFKYEIKKEYHVSKFNSKIILSCTDDRIYSIPKNQLDKWGGIRVFECRIWGKCILEKNNKIGSEFLKLYRELKIKEFVEYIDSRWAYYYCRSVKDIKEVRDKITDSRWAYYYCRNIKDIKEVRDKITGSEWPFYYCKNVKDRKEVRDKITDSRWAYYYCRDIKDRKEIRDKITGSEWPFYYCKNVKDRKEVRDKITDSEWAYIYCRDIKDRKEIRDKTKIM